VIALIDTTGLVMTTDRKRTSHAAGTENVNVNVNVIESTIVVTLPRDLRLLELSPIRGTRGRAMDVTPETPETEMEGPGTGGITRAKHPADPQRNPLEDPGLRPPLPLPVPVREGTVVTEGMSAEGGRGSMIGRLIGGLSRRVGGGERRREPEAWFIRMMARSFRVSISISSL
jgi:hypothetical protein